MSLGRRCSDQERRWQAAKKTLNLSGHPYYQRLNFALEESGFDSWVEGLCRPFYAPRRGRPSVPPGTYFRMLYVARVENIPSQRGLAWRCADSLSLREFLGTAPGEPTPDHSTLTVIRRRYPVELHDKVVTFMDRLATAEGLRSSNILRGEPLLGHVCQESEV